MYRKFCLFICIFFFTFTLVSSDLYGGSGSITGPSIDNGAKVRYRGAGKMVSRSLQKVQVKQDNHESYYEHTLAGDWDDVVAHVGFFHDFDGLGEAFISIMGLGTYQEGNGVYSTDYWDRQAFWIEIGDGVPMHLASEFIGEYYADETETDTVYIYSNLNILYRQQGKDYSNTEFGGEWIKLEVTTDPYNNYIDHEVYIYDENDEVIENRKLEIGDEIQSWTAYFYLDDPDAYWLTTMEEEFRPITLEPNIFFEHLTPNVDFPNSITLDIIDFTNVDLQLSLMGYKEDPNTGINDYFFSKPKDLILKWGLNPSTNVMDWLLSFF